MFYTKQQSRRSSLVGLLSYNITKPFYYLLNCYYFILTYHWYSKSYFKCKFCKYQIYSVHIAEAVLCWQGLYEHCKFHTHPVSAVLTGRVWTLMPYIPCQHCVDRESSTFHISCYMTNLHCKVWLWISVICENGYMLTG